jgi:tripeptidyl-peptidase-1
MFECDITKYINTKTKQEKIGSKNGYTIPSEMSSLIELVSGMNTFPSSRWESVATNSRLQDDAVITAEITPQTIYDVYQVDKSGSHGSKKGSQAVIEFGKLANFNTKDLQDFFSDYQPDLKGEECGMASGENNGDVRASVEANLDVQYIMATGVYVNTTDYKLITGNSENGIEDDFLSYTQMVNAQYEPPLVHSISYGEYGGSYDNATDQRFSYELQKMGISGISVLLASGDNGVGCDNTGSSQEFDYPSSPYITMVGATYIDKSTNKEVGATLSSGGFSKDFYQASWQSSAVEGYFASGIALPDEYYERYLYLYI